MSGLSRKYFHVNSRNEISNHKLASHPGSVNSGYPTPRSISACLAMRVSAIVSSDRKGPSSDAITTATFLRHLYSDLAEEDFPGRTSPSGSANAQRWTE